ncbi:hypothetical protein [Mucilaginibacter sp.]|uniref:hypothetical protein n=1 Tax=Mucilaginibacter sp. TaxID=1882438 RepID=UPI0035BBE745
MTSAIHYRDMIKLMAAGAFSMVYLSCHRSKKTGGDWITVENVTKCGLPYSCKDHEMIGYREESGKITAVHLRLVFQINGMQVYP